MYIGDHYCVARMGNEQGRPGGLERQGSAISAQRGVADLRNAAMDKNQAKAKSKKLERLLKEDFKMNQTI